MLRCFHYSVGSVHDLRRNRALVVYQYCKCHKRWLAFAENFWKNLQEIPGKNLDRYLLHKSELVLPRMAMIPLSEIFDVPWITAFSIRGWMISLGI